MELIESAGQIATISARERSQIQGKRAHNYKINKSAHLIQVQRVAIVSNVSFIYVSV